MAADRHGPRVGGGDRPWRAVRGLSASNASSCVASRLATGQDKLCFNMATKFDGLVIHKLVFYGVTTPCASPTREDTERFS